MTLPLASLLAACLAAASPHLLPAQYVDSLTVGAHVRVASARGGRFDATLVRADSAGGLTVARPPRDTATLAWPDVRALERYDGRRSAGAAFGRGARLGAAVVGALGIVGVAAVAVSDMRRRGDDFYGVPITVVAAQIATVYTAAGAVVGGTIGLAFRDRWTSVRRPAVTREAAGP